VIAKRELERRGGGEPVVVRIGRPAEDPEGDWYCPVQITGVGDDTVYKAFGADSMQALVLALQMLRARLGAEQREHGLTWLGMDDLGV
jgi:hypothetical protein